MQLCRNRKFVRFVSIVLIILIIFVCDPPITTPWKKRVDSKPSRSADDRVFYAWIDELGRTLNGTKPPVYGVFVLLDLDYSSYMTSHDAFIKQLADYEFGFSSCHEVRPCTTKYSKCCNNLDGFCRHENILLQGNFNCNKLNAAIT